MTSCFRDQVADCLPSSCSVTVVDHLLVAHSRSRIQGSESDTAVGEWRLIKFICYTKRR